MTVAEAAGRVFICRREVDGYVMGQRPGPRCPMRCPRLAIAVYEGDLAMARRTDE
jgi:hypothetical protein